MANISGITVRKIIKVIEGGCADDCSKCPYKNNDECFNLKKYDKIKEIIKRNYGGINE